MLAHKQKIAMLTLTWGRARVAVWINPSCSPSSYFNVNMSAHSVADLGVGWGDAPPLA